MMVPVICSELLSAHGAASSLLASCHWQTTAAALLTAAGTKGCTGAVSGQEVRDDRGWMLMSNPCPPAHTKAEKLHLSNSQVTHLPAGATARGLHSAVCLAAGLALHQHAHILRPLALSLVLVPLLGASALLGAALLAMLPV